MGGIVTDLDGLAGERLYAVGECACTGLHGANRLASNSLSECFVFGRRAALKGLDDAAARRAASPTPATRSRRRPARPARPSGALAGLERNAADLDELGERPAPARAARRRSAPRPARRPAARTRAPSSRSSTRRSTAATRSSTPAARPRASSRGPRSAADRLGRRAHDEHAGLLRRVRARAREPTSARAFREDPTPASALADLESGRIDLATFERRLADALGVDRRTTSRAA